MKTFSQAGQDLFVIAMTGSKLYGTFLEIGSNDAILINNTYLLESAFGWKGVMVDIDNAHLERYKEYRPNSVWLIDDATKIDYMSALSQIDKSGVIDYLQIDLEVSNESTINTLDLLDKTVMDTYKFATVTFEHDIYAGDHFYTRGRSREIFERRGYIRVFSDVMNENHAYEDWYVHPSCISEDKYKPFVTEESLEHTEIVNRIKSIL
jgi:hypothetical protein